jgi:hypothetical protein
MATLLVWAACTSVVFYYAFWRSGIGPWAFYLLGAIGCGAILRKLHALRKNSQA